MRENNTKAKNSFTAAIICCISAIIFLIMGIILPMIELPIKATNLTDVSSANADNNMYVDGEIGRVLGKYTLSIDTEGNKTNSYIILINNKTIMIAYTKDSEKSNQLQQIMDSTNIYNIHNASSSVAVPMKVTGTLIESSESASITFENDIEKIKKLLGSDNIYESLFLYALNLDADPTEVISKYFDYAAWASFASAVILVIIATVCYMKSKKPLEYMQVNTMPDTSNKAKSNDDPFDSIEVPNNPFDSSEKSEKLPFKKDEKPDDDDYYMPKI